MIKRGDFWIGILMAILFASIFLWGELTIDINLHDTYIVTTYAHFLYPTLLWFAIVMVLYFVLAKKNKKVGRWTQSAHILLSFLTTFMYIYQIWGSIIAVSGHTTRYFPTASDWQLYGTIILLNLLVFIVIQVVFIGAFIRRMVGR